MTTRFKQSHILLLISVALVAATVVAYEPIRHNGFVNIDDDVYITKNPNVTGGILVNSVIWAFTKHIYGKLASVDVDKPYAGLRNLRPESAGSPHN